MRSREREKEGGGREDGCRLLSLASRGTYAPQIVTEEKEGGKEGKGRMMGACYCSWPLVASTHVHVGTSHSQRKR